MIKGTTPTFQLKLISDSVDLTLAENVYATFKQKNNGEWVKVPNTIISEDEHYEKGE